MKKKRILSLICAVAVGFGVITAGLTSCGDKKEDERKTFTVGFDAEFPPTAIRTTAGSMWALTLTWHKRYARETAGSW